MTDDSHVSQVLRGLETRVWADLDQTEREDLKGRVWLAGRLLERAYVETLPRSLRLGSKEYGSSDTRRAFASKVPRDYVDVVPTSAERKMLADRLLSRLNESAELTAAVAGAFVNTDELAAIPSLTSILTNCTAGLDISDGNKFTECDRAVAAIRTLLARSSLTSAGVQKNSHIAMSVENALRAMIAFANMAHQCMDEATEAVTRARWDLLYTETEDAVDEIQQNLKRKW